MQLSAVGLFAAFGFAACVEVPLDGSNPPPGGPDGGTHMTDGSSPPAGASWHWESPAPQGNNLRGLWGVPGATAAQDVLYAAGENGTMVIGSGKSYQVQQLDPSINRAFLAISGQVSSQGSGQASSAEPLVLGVGLFDLALLSSNGQWTDLNPLLGSGDGSLYGIWPTANSGEFFVVGTTGQIYLVEGSRNTWTPEGAGVTTNSLFSVAGTGMGSTMEVYAVGDSGTVLHRVNGTWSVEANGLVSQQLSAVLCGTELLAGEVFAVGDSGTVLHKQNGNWTTESPPTTSALYALWGLSDEIYAAGANGTLLRRQGGMWQPEGNGLTTERLSALWGTSHNGQTSVYAAGSLGTLLQRQNGTWSQLSTQVTSTPLAGVWARSSTEVYAVGSGGLVLRRSGSPSTGTWMTVASGATTSDLNAVSGYAAGSSGTADVYAVGLNGTILHQSSASGSWAVEGVVLTSAELTAVWAGADSVWVVGQGGVIGKKVGTSWTPQTGPNNMSVSQDLFSVWGTGQGASQVTYVGGAQGLILRHDSTGWTQEAMGLLTETVVSLFGGSETELRAFGDKGTVLHRVSPGQWQPESIGQFSSGANGVAGVAVPNSTDLYAVGTQGLLLHYTGSRWLTDVSPTLQSASAITASSSTDVIAVGANGLILHKY